MSFKKHPRTKWSLFLIVTLIVSGLLLVRFTTVQAQESTDPEAIVAQAWRLAQESGRYEFRSQIE
ncbi:MAG: hypothetical protein WAM60_13550, partial [Candidatus Promineifilaceae bacterium]